MSDVLALLDRLSLVFQERNIDFSHVQPLVNCCIRAIEEMNSPGPALQDLPAVLENIAAYGITIKMCENVDLRFHDHS